MGQTEPQPRRYTLEEYFAFEARSEMHYEYLAGEVVALGSGSVAHNIIKSNLVEGLRRSILNNRRYSSHVHQLVDGDTPVAVQEADFYAYPDAMVSPDPIDRKSYDAWRQPVLIAEVLSASTAAYDSTTKFANYQKIHSLRHYLLISQAAWIVEWFRRDEAGQWIYTLLTGPDSTLEIPDLGLVLPLRELYEDTDVAPLRVMPGAGEGVQD